MHLIIEWIQRMIVRRGRTYNGDEALAAIDKQATVLEKRCEEMKEELKQQQDNASPEEKEKMRLLESQVREISKQIYFLRMRHRNEVARTRLQ